MRVEEAEPPDVRVMDEGLREAWGPGGETAALNVIVPEKLLTLVSVMETVPDESWATVREVGLEFIVKFGDEGDTTETLMFVLRVPDAEPLAPVTVMLYDPDEVDWGIEIVSLEEAVDPEETITGLVLKVVIGPGGDDEAERVIVPAKLLMLDTDMVLLAFELWGIEMFDGLAEI